MSLRITDRPATKASTETLSLAFKFLVLTKDNRIRDTSYIQEARTQPLPLALGPQHVGMLRARCAVKRDRVAKNAVEVLEQVCTYLYVRSVCRNTYRSRQTRAAAKALATCAA